MNQSTMSILMLVLIIVVMYFLLIRPQKKKEKAIKRTWNIIVAPVGKPHNYIRIVCRYIPNYLTTIITWNCYDKRFALIYLIANLCFLCLDKKIHSFFQISVHNFSV